jgi:hypothetical protein
MPSLLVPANVVEVNVTITNPGAVTNLVVHSAAAKPIVIIRAKIQLAQATIPSAADAKVKLTKKTAAGTYTSIAASTFFNADPAEPDPSFTAGHTASAEGTDGDFWEEGWGQTTGWTFEWAPTPEEYKTIAAGTANGFALKSSVAPPAGVYTFNLTVGEIG